MPRISIKDLEAKRDDAFKEFSIAENLLNLKEQELIKEISHLESDLRSIKMYVTIKLVNIRLKEIEGELDNLTIELEILRTNISYKLGMLKEKKRKARKGNFEFAIDGMAKAKAHADKWDLEYLEMMHENVSIRQMSEDITDYINHS